MRSGIQGFLLPIGDRSGIQGFLLPIGDIDTMLEKLHLSLTKMMDININM